MCGIVGYTGSRSCRGILIEGLRHLEYRGYDSAGIALVGKAGVESVHAVGKLSFLEEAIAASDERDGGTATFPIPATAGIAHTRWATHGRVTEANAHPHDDPSSRVHIVMNGIVENWSELRRRLESEGAEFTSETDTEVVAHLIASYLDEGLLEAVRRAYGELRGHYTIVALSSEEPELLVGARKETPLVVGRGEGENYFGSAVPAFLGRDPEGAVRRGRRDRGHDPRRGAHLHRRRRGGRARDRGGRLGRVDRREGRLRDLHAQGDPRAARRHRRDGR